jgi:hypothetical protein
VAVEESLWTFVRVEGVEPANNHIERLLRLAVRLAEEVVRQPEGVGVPLRGAAADSGADVATARAAGAGLPV